MAKTRSLSAFERLARTTVEGKAVAKKADDNRETIPGMSWEPICDGLLEVAPYIPFEKDADSQGVRRYRRLSADTNLPQCIGIHIQRGPEWKFPVRMQRVYVPNEALNMLDADTLKAANKVASAIEKAVKLAAAK